MPSAWVTEFTGGLDVRKLPETSRGGTLIRAVDCHINRGGEIEQRAVFAPVWQSPLAATTGLVATRDRLVVFGHAAAAPAGLPPKFLYQRLQHPGGRALASIRHAALYRGKVYALAEFSDGSLYEFYDGARVTDTNAPSLDADAAQPAAAFTFGSKIFVGAGSVLHNSAVAAPTDFTGTGAGFKDLATFAEGADLITAIGRYENRLAVFLEDQIQTWAIDPDPTKDAQIQVLAGTGCVAPRAALPFRDGDLVYLDRTGVRSLRARDSSNSAATTDLGSPVDDALIPLLETLPPGAVQRISMIAEPRHGRLWLAMGDVIYVFSYFEGARISAWTTYRPGFTVDAMAVYDRRVYLRSGDTIYVYGSESGPFQYSADVKAVAWLPYMDAEAPAREKQITAFDIAARGAWEVRVGMDPKNLDASDRLARVEGSTFMDGIMSAIGAATHMSLRFESVAPPSAAAPAIVSSAVLHFARHKDEDTGR